MRSPVTGNDIARVLQEAEARGIKYGTVTAAPWSHRAVREERFVYLNGQLTADRWLAALCAGVAELSQDNVTVLDPHTRRRTS